MVFRRINKDGSMHASVHSRYLWVALVLAVGFAFVFYVFPDNGDGVTGAAGLPSIVTATTPTEVEWLSCGNTIDVGKGKKYSANYFLCTTESAGSYCYTLGNGYVKKVGSNYYKCANDDNNGAPSHRSWLLCDSNKDSGDLQDIDKAVFAYQSEDSPDDNNAWICAGNSEKWYVCPKVQSTKAGGDYELAEEGQIIGSNFCKLGTGFVNCGLVEDLRNNQVTSMYCYHGEWDRCENTEKVISENYLCVDETWTICNNANDDSLSQSNKYLCKSSAWQICDGNNNLVYSEDFQYQCQNNQWQEVADATPPAGYYWTQPPVASELDGGSCTLVNSLIWHDLDFLKGVEGVNVKTGCCPNTNNCVAPFWENNDDKCYSSGSIMSQNNYLCGSETFNEQDTPTWIYCGPNLDTDKILYQDDKYLCQKAVDNNFDGKWKVCNQENKGRAANIELGSDFDLKFAEVTTNPLLKYYCDGTKWIECNAENLGFAMGDEEYVCQKKNPFWWANLLPLNKNGLFEIRISESDPDKIVPLVTTGMHNPANVSVYSEVNLCDDGTEHVSFKATLCYKDHPHLPGDPDHGVNNANDEEIQVIISSNEFLQGTNELMKTMEGDNVLYMFEESEGEKQISMFPVLEPDATFNNAGPFLSVGILATNFKQGRRLAMEVDGVHYLLRHPPEDLDINKLSILEVPSGEVIEVNKLSSTKHQFIIQALKVIALEIVGDKVHFNIEQPLEAVAGQVVNHDLSKEFEVSFDREHPVRLIDFENATGDNPIYSVCIEDNSADPSRMLICENDVQVATLHVNEASFLKIDNSNNNGVNGAFFRYEMEDGKKVTRIYYTKLLNENNIEIDYNDFINSMVAGRRIAFSIETEADLAAEGSDALYLLTHPVQQFISLPDLQLVQITTEGEEVPSPFVGSYKKAQSLVEAGRLTVKQEAINPPPPFIIEWENRNAIIDQEINLDQQFFTQVKSNFPANIVLPNFGVIHVHDNDVVKSAMSFRLNTGTELGEGVNGILRLPLVTDNLMDAVVVGENGNSGCGSIDNPSCALFHYFSAQVLQGDFIKTAAIYKYLDISEKNTWRKLNFSDDFIDTFTSGSPIALGTEEMNYLVGYAAGVEGQQDFFRLEGVVLINLDGSIVYTKEVQNSKGRVIFTVPDSEERIVVEIDDEDGKIFFYSTTQNILTGEEFTDYAHFLMPDNSVNILGKTYQICDTPDFALFEESVLICEGGNQFVVNKSQPLSIITSEDVAPVGGQNLCGAVAQMFGPGGLAVQELVAQVPFGQVPFGGGPIANPINPAAANNANPICNIQQVQVGAEEEKYLLWYRGREQGKKVVSIHKIEVLVEDEEAVPLGWATFTENIEQKKSKAFFWNNNFYELLGKKQTNNQVDDLILSRIPDKQQFQIGGIESIQELENGMFNVNDKLLDLEQVLSDDFKINLILDPWGAHLLTNKGFNVTGTGVIFVPSLGAPKYRFIVYDPANLGNPLNLDDGLSADGEGDINPTLLMVRIIDEETDDLLYGAMLPWGTITEALLNNGDTVEIVLESPQRWYQNEEESPGEAHPAPAVILRR